MSTSDRISVISDERTEIHEDGCFFSGQGCCKRRVVISDRKTVIADRRVGISGQTLVPAIQGSSACHRNEGFGKTKSNPTEETGKQWGESGNSYWSHVEELIRNRSKVGRGGAFGRGGLSGLEEEYLGDLQHKDLEEGEEREIWHFFNPQTLVLTQETNKSFCPFN